MANSKLILLSPFRSAFSRLGKNAGPLPRRLRNDRTAHRPGYHSLPSRFRGRSGPDCKGDYCTAEIEVSSSAHVPTAHLLCPLSGCSQALHYSLSGFLGWQFARFKALK